MAEPKTICFNCRHHKRTGTSDIWYDQVCNALDVQKVPDIDPVSGAKGFASQNSLGMGYLSDIPQPYCRDINHGHCPHFAAARKLTSLGT